MDSNDLPLDHDPFLAFPEMVALVEVTARRRAADEVAEAARDAQAAAIREALGARFSVADVARATGMSRERIYQIRDGRR